MKCFMGRVFWHVQWAHESLAMPQLNHGSIADEMIVRTDRARAIIAGDKSQLGKPFDKGGLRDFVSDLVLGVWFCADHCSHSAVMRNPGRIKNTRTPQVTLKVEYIPSRPLLLSSSDKPVLSKPEYPRTQPVVTGPPQSRAFR